MKKHISLLSAISLSGSLFAVNNNLLYKENFKVNSIRTIELNLTSEKVTVTPIYGDEITIEVRSNNRTRVPVVSTSANTLYISSSRFKDTGIADYCYVDIFIPYDSKFETIDFNLTSGKLTVENISADTCIFKNNSGEIKASKIEVTEMQIKSTSGHIDLINFSGEYLNLQATSGSIRTRSLVCDYFDVNTSSGSIEIDLEKAPSASCEIRASSGSVNLIIPDKRGFDLIVSSSSGSFKDEHLGKRFSPRGGYTNSYYGGGPEISISTSSGSIYLGR